MCTVTYLPLDNGHILTSNRDEQLLRQAAAPPELIEGKTGGILFPRDGKAGGTWIAAHSNGNKMVLLNGAFQRHIPAPPYRKSRGLVFLDIFDSADPLDSFHITDLHNIEPFTLVISQHNGLFEARWDGEKRYCAQMIADRPHIWQSATLYDEDIRKLREEWFRDWLSKQKGPVTADAIQRFHEFGGTGDNALKMNRDGLLQTVSITCMATSSDTTELYYHDLLHDTGAIHRWSVTPERQQYELKTLPPLSGKAATLGVLEQ